MRTMKMEITDTDDLNIQLKQLEYINYWNKRMRYDPKTACYMLNIPYVETVSCSVVQDFENHIAEMFEKFNISKESI
ncbi:MAG: hypothetical protein V5B36_00820 [Candidatus Accumulibacter sp. UW25]|jgi:hypothetical protein